MKKESFVHSCKIQEPPAIKDTPEPDPTFETPLRPSSLEEFVGQSDLCDKIRILTGAAKMRKEALGHVLLCGPPGLGKTTLAHILAKAMGTRLVVTSGPVIERAGDLAGVLTSLKEGDVLFIDEIHRLNKVVEEYLYPAMEDFALDLMIDSGPSSRSVQVKLNKFTLVGATTKAGLLSAPMRSRFAFMGRLEYYEPLILQKIVMRSAGILNVDLDIESSLEIAKRSRGTPRIANNLLRWVRDYAAVHTDAYIDREIVQQALEMMNIDAKGLDEMDLKLLRVLIEHYDGGPVGVGTLAVSIGEEAHTLEEVYEPYLIMQGLLKRTSRGREATALAYQHIGIHQGEKNV